MPKAVVTRGTTLNGKPVNPGEILDLTDEVFAKLHRDVELYKEPKAEPVKPKTKKP